MYFFAPRRCLAFKKKIVLTQKKLVVDENVFHNFHSPYRCINRIR